MITIYDHDHSPNNGNTLADIDLSPLGVRFYYPGYPEGITPEDAHKLALEISRLHSTAVMAHVSDLVWQNLISHADSGCTLVRLRSDGCEPCAPESRSPLALRFLPKMQELVEMKVLQDVVSCLYDTKLVGQLRTGVVPVRCAKYFGFIPCSGLESIWILGVGALLCAEASSVTEGAAVIKAKTAEVLSRAGLRRPVPAPVACSRAEFLKVLADSPEFRKSVRREWGSDSSGQLNLPRELEALFDNATGRFRLTPTEDVLCSALELIGSRIGVL